MSSFDPYHRWLGIPPKHRPIDHYRLLGLDRFERDPEVIIDAVERQISHVRRYAAGSKAKIAQQILNELATAKVTLLDSKARAAYDAQLKQTVVAPARPRKEMAAARERESTLPLTAWIGIAVGGLLGLFLIAGLLFAMLPSTEESSLANASAAIGARLLVETPLASDDVSPASNAPLPSVDDDPPQNSEPVPKTPASEPAPVEHKFGESETDESFPGQKLVQPAADKQGASQTVARQPPSSGGDIAATASNLANPRRTAPDEGIASQASGEDSPGDKPAEPTAHDKSPATTAETAEGEDPEESTEDATGSLTGIWHGLSTRGVEANTTYRLTQNGKTVKIEIIDSSTVTQGEGVLRLTRDDRIKEWEGSQTVRFQFDTFKRDRELRTTLRQLTEDKLLLKEDRVIIHPESGKVSKRFPLADRLQLVRE